MTKTIDPQALLAWLEGQDPSTSYEFWDVNDCLFARYGKAVYAPAEGETITGGGYEFNVWNEDGTIKEYHTLSLSPAVYSIASGFGADLQSTAQVRDGWNYGDAAQRLRDAMAANVEAV